MPSSRSEIRRAPGPLGALVALLLLGGPGGCDELNPDYDPDGGPICSPGERRCNLDAGVPEVCQTATSWTPLEPCWAGSGCNDGLCLPVAPFERCTHFTDCATAGDVCTAFVDPDALGALATFCVVSPNAAGNPPGQACDGHDDCASGWCYRRICYEACADASQCTNSLHECALLDVTVDGVSDNSHIHGCVPPAPTD